MDQIARLNAVANRLQAIARAILPHCCNGPWPALDDDPMCLCGLCHAFRDAQACKIELEKAIDALSPEGVPS